MLRYEGQNWADGFTLRRCKSSEKTRTNNNPSPHHHNGTAGVLQRYMGTNRSQRQLVSLATLELTKPYKNNEGIPVMTLMIEKDTPKF